MSDQKIISFLEAPHFYQKIKKEGKKIVQCHGTFDLVHPGHIVHLQEAKSKGDCLVVTITADNQVNKGPGRPCFNDEMRSLSLAALECVDYVTVIPFSAAVEAIESVKPDFYCKGKEYESPENDPTGNILNDIQAVEKNGGKVLYLGDVVFSSTKLINRNFQTISPKVKTFSKNLSNKVSPQSFRDAIDDYEKLKVLVLGDIIFDRYSYLRVQGLTSKNRIISGRFLREDTQGGGALAVYRHIKQFAGTVKILGLLGVEDWIDPMIRQELPVEDDLCIRVKNFTSIVKRRFVEPLCEGKEMSKLFSVNYIDSQHPGDEVEDLILERLDNQLKEYDLVVVADFGHGTMLPRVREYVQKNARFMALNCQTNSNNHGFNIISKQYYRADAFSLDLQEILLACGKRNVDVQEELGLLKEKLGANYAWLTRGAVETIGLKSGESVSICPPLENDITDTVGAGDAFFSVAALSAACNQSIDFSTLVGQLAGAQAVKIVGNTQSISKSQLVKGGMALLSY